MFLKGLLGYLPANLLQGIVGFLTLWLFTRMLSPEDYGRYALAFGVTSLVYTVCFCWIEAAMARFYPAEKLDNVEAPELYGTLYRLHITVAGLFMAVCAGGLYIWPAKSPGDLATKAAIGAGLVGIVFRTLLRMVQEQRRSEGRVREAAAIDMLQTVGGFLLGLGFVTLGFRGGAPLLGMGVMAALLLPFVAREDWRRAAHGVWSRPKALAYARYGYPVTLSLILTLSLYTLDRFFIAYFMGEADVGAYQAGFSLASRVIDVLFLWFAAAGAPAMINALETGGEAALEREAKQQILWIALLAFPAMAGLISLAPALSQWMIGPQLREKALSIIPLVSLGALMAGLNSSYFLLSFTLAKKTHLLMLAMSVPAIANVVLNLILIPKMGVQGAALAYVLCFAIGIATSWILGLRATLMPLPLIDLCKIGLAATAMALALSHLPHLSMLAELLIKPPLGILIYGTLVLGFNISGSRAYLLAIFNKLSRRLATS